MKFSEILDKPLLSLSEGSVVGKVRGCLLNEDKTRLLALDTGDGWVLAKDAQVGESAVLVKSADAVSAELPAGAAGAEHPADIDVIEPAQGLFNASRAQKVISFEDVLSPKCASTCAVVPLVPVKVKLTLSSSVLIDFEPTALPS